MITNIDIDESLVAEAMTVSGARTKREVVDRALREMVARAKRPRLRDIFGMRSTSGPVLEKPKDLAALLTNLEKNDVLFIDEIHRLSPVVEEILYPALEDYQIDIMVQMLGVGPAYQSETFGRPQQAIDGAVGQLPRPR